MKLTVLKVDCDSSLALKQQPHVVFQDPEIVGEGGKNTAGRWRSLRTPLVDGEPAQWASVMPGEKRVYIPLFSYTTKSQDTHAMMSVIAHASGMSVAQAIASLASHEHIEEHMVALGDVYDLCNGFQFWIGFAFRIRG